MEDDDPQWKDKKVTIKVKRKDWGIWLSLRNRVGVLIYEDEIPILKKELSKIQLKRGKR